MFGKDNMRQLEVLGASLLLKLLVTDLWTLLWTIFSYTSYAGEELSPIVRREVSPFTPTHFEPIGDYGAVFNPYDA